MKKSFGILFSSVLLFSMMPFSALASTESFEGKTISSDEMISVSGKEVENTKVLVKAINELDAKLDMEDLPANSQKEINQLTPEAKKLYDSIASYKNQASASLTSDDALVIFSEYVGELNKNKLSNPKKQTFTTMGLGINYKEYKISNSKIKQLSNAVGVNSGFWATATAIARYFSYSPTALTLMLAAVPMLGMSTINACNSKGKGIIITQMGSGATNTYSCRSQ
ncbi:hypothetical protein [Bacillus haynesii]|uniref:hypothetical protein n=1 Tax=Bacillus haynesii TaxID=1925021 RepID=UPI0015947F44|nr:hypothetical protein [Bacillus haynesii]NVB33313.1 hypothetical protein [Bacillus licheniformis]MCY7779552.1 hypothetical protein [Bacillus haynesii]MCY7860549.1 hypothetical protein [Bacillus haynesii]MCY8342688.1 hypothetical protein [Bacillus haynesii]MCY8672516.1 hypothetical protein [Bacillus haynesii]